MSEVWLRLDVRTNSCQNTMNHEPKLKLVLCSPIVSHQSKWVSNINVTHCQTLEDGVSQPNSSRSAAEPYAKISFDHNLPASASPFKPMNNSPYLSIICMKRRPHRNTAREARQAMLLAKYCNLQSVWHFLEPCNESSSASPRLQGCTANNNSYSCLRFIGSSPESCENGAELVRITKLLKQAY